MKRLPALSVAAAAFLVSNAGFSDPLPVTGQWRILDDDNRTELSVVQIYEHGGKMFGKVISGKESVDSNGKLKLCTRCEGADRNKPFIGLVIMKNLTRDGDEYTGGTIMDPTDGTVYRCKIEAVEGGRKLHVRGFVGISLLGRTQTWIRK